MYRAARYGLEARTKRLTVENLKEAFGNLMTVREENGRAKCRVALGKNPYGSLTVDYFDPEVGTRPDGTVTVQDIREAPLFTGGYRDSVYLGAINKQLVWGHFLMGNFEDEKMPKFIVGFDGIDDDHYILLRLQADDPILTDEFIGGLKHTARYFEPLFDAEEDVAYYIAVIKSDTKLSQSGEEIEGAEGVIDAEVMRGLSLRLFHKQFSHAAVDNGVCFDQGWVLDEYGSRLEPRLRLKVNEDVDSGEDSDAPLCPTEVWTRLDRNMVILSCQTWFDGTVHLQCACWKDDAPNALQYRMMDVIASEIVAKLQESQKAYGGDEDYSKLCWEFVYL